MSTHAMTRYEPVIHESARRELDDLESNQRERLTNAIADVAGNRKPSSHEKVRQMANETSLLRVRAGEVRAVVELQSPELRVLRVGHRRDVYDDVDGVVSDRRTSG
jgi:mRNA-degrading endonuclease RelE of RelBE toxin-antitoxin system